MNPLDIGLVTLDRTKFYARVIDSLEVGVVHKPIADFAKKFVEDLYRWAGWTTTTDDNVTAPVPGGDWNKANALVQRIMLQEMPLVASFWGLYHLKGVFDSEISKLNPNVGNSDTSLWTLGASGAVASMLAGGLTLVLSAMAQKLGGLNQIQKLGEGTLEERMAAVKEFLKGLHYQGKVDSSKSSTVSDYAFHGLTRSIASLIGSLCMLSVYGLSLQAGGTTTTTTTTKSPTPQTGSTLPDVWESLQNSGFAMALYLLGWDIARPILEVGLGHPSPDNEYNSMQNEGFESYLDERKNNGRTNVLGDDENVVSGRNEELGLGTGRISYKNPEDTEFDIQSDDEIDIDKTVRRLMDDFKDPEIVFMDDGDDDSDPTDELDEKENFIVEGRDKITNEESETIDINLVTEKNTNEKDITTIDV
jgi:hypothetical protein